MSTDFLETGLLSPQQDAARLTLVAGWYTELADSWERTQLRNFVFFQALGLRQISWDADNGTWILHC